MKLKPKQIAKFLRRYGRTLADTCQQPVTLPKAPWEIEEEDFK